MKIRVILMAAQEEVIASQATLSAAGIEIEGLEKRNLDLKGKSELVSVRVLHAD